MKLVIGLLACCSKENYMQQILTCEATWCKSSIIPIHYFTGQNCPNKICNNNVVHLPNVGDDVLSATYKQWYGLRWLYDKYPDAEFYYLAGTDTYAKIDKILEYLNTLDSKENLYIGGHGWIRTATGKEVYYHSGGSGFILSNSLMKNIYDFIPEWINIWNLHTEWIRVACDWSIAELFLYKNINVKTISLNTFKACNFKGIGKNGIVCCNNVDSKKDWVFHYMDLKDMIELYQS